MCECQTLTADQMMLQHLGASVLLCWNDLPWQTQELILDQANDAVGIVPVPRIRDQIAYFLMRRTRVRDRLVLPG
jgi:hypothetical protein